MAMQKSWNLTELPKPAEMEADSKELASLRLHVAAWYLWRSLDNK